MSRVTQVSARSLIVFAYGAITLYGPSFQTVLLTNRFITSRLNTGQVLQPQRIRKPSGWAVPRSLAATNGITDLFSLPSGTKMVHFPEFASPNL